MHKSIYRRLLLLAAACGFAVSAHAQIHHVADGTTSLAFDSELIEATTGLVLTSTADTVPPYSGAYDVGLALTAATDFWFSSDFTMAGGSLEHWGSLTFNDGVDDFIVGNLSIRYDPTRMSALYSGLYVVDTLGGYGELFEVGHFADPLISGSSVLVGPAALYISSELGATLLANGFSQTDLTGLEIGTAVFDGTIGAVPDEGGLGITALAAAGLLAAARVRRRFAAATTSG